MRWLSGAVVLCTGQLVGRAVQAALPWVSYEATSGCPERAVFEQELEQRSNTLTKTPNPSLLITISSEGAAYVGQVRLHDGDRSLSRQVRHESCDQVVRALALISALMLETEWKRATQAAEPLPPPQAPAPPPPVQPEAAPSSPPSPRPRTVITPGQTQAPLGSQAHAVDYGVSFAANSERLITTGFWLGMRLSARLSTRQLWPGTEQTIRLSAARIDSTTLGDQQRTASVEWLSSRLDACHGSFPFADSALGACAAFDLGRLTGQGTVGGVKREKQVLWSRAGVALYLRQRLLSPLTLEADLGLFVPLSDPEFYFAATATASELPLTRVRSVGPAANLGLGLEFE